MTIGKGRKRKEEENIVEIKKENWLALVSQVPNIKILLYPVDQFRTYRQIADT